jgi:hypothetical protein
MRRLLVAGALALLVSGCGAPSPSGPPVSVQPAETPVPTPRGIVPPTTCHNYSPEWWAKWRTTAPDGSQVPVAITLTCENAVVAAWNAVSDRAGITSAEFTMGVMCLPQMPCPAAPPNTGQVAFHRSDGTGVYVTVQSDASGTVSPDRPAVWPIPRRLPDHPAPTSSPSAANAG